MATKFQNLNERAAISIKQSQAQAEPPVQLFKPWIGLARSRSAEWCESAWFRRRVSTQVLRRRRSHDSPIQLLEEGSFKVAIEGTRDTLLAQEDTNHDLQITVDDKGPKVFLLPTARSDGSRSSEIRGTYVLANLLQELVLARDLGRLLIVLDGAQLTEDPVDRISRRIHDMFWDNLSRRMDRSLIETVARDPKDWTNDPRPRIYVPEKLTEQYEYYTHAAESLGGLGLEVCSLPKGDVTADFIRTLNARPGILALQMQDHGDGVRGLEYVVPGGRFNELYGWDSYFCALGLLEVGRAHTAKDIALNLSFEIEHYGRILNANRSYYLGRSQPPFLTDLALRTYAKIHQEPGAKGFLLTTILAAIREYNRVWMSEPRFDPRTGLSRYRPIGAGMPPEVEESHFDHIIVDRATQGSMTKKEFIDAYNAGRIEDPKLDNFFLHDRAVRESGHDTSYRLENLAADLATIDLNALLFKYETDIAYAISEVFNDRLEIPEYCLPAGAQHAQFDCSSLWIERARSRKTHIDRYLWNEHQGIFCDYNTLSGEKTEFESVTCLWALWSGVADDRQAALLVANALPLFEHHGGLSCTSRHSVGPKGPEQPQRQWDYPYGWAPHQIMAWDGLRRYGYHKEAERLAYRWLHMITQAAVDFNGVIVEKYDVTVRHRPHEVDAEYGNQGRAFEGLAREGFGWTNASYSYGLTFINKILRKALGLGLPYEAVDHLSII